jgi:hypothetical protein
LNRNLRRTDTVNGTISPTLELALEEVVIAAAAVACDRWWIIGSAAAALHGAEVGEVVDIDLLMSRRDAARLLRSRGLAPVPGAPSDRFRSTAFGRFDAGGFEVEVMGGLHLRVRGEWRPVRLRGRETVAVAGGLIHLPPRRELVTLLRRFGRDKDLARAAALEALE